MVIRRASTVVFPAVLHLLAMESDDAITIYRMDSSPEVFALEPAPHGDFFLETFIEELW
jgi:hypothetical protein